MLAFVCAIVATAAQAADASARAYTLALDSEPAPVIAGERVGTFPQAVRAFGRPSTATSTGGAECTVSWKRIGLRIAFSASRAGTCARRVLGSWIRVQASDPRWHTAAGLRVGDSAARLHALYPQARRLDFVGPDVWEVEDGGPLCDGGAPLALVAQTRAGSVRTLAVRRIPACG